VQFIICWDDNDAAHPLLVMPAPIQLPSLKDRAAELPRIVDEYFLDAIAAVGARSTCLTDRDRAWVLAHETSSLSEIEKATLRVAALRTSANLSIAAERLGMAAVSLSRWACRRNLPVTGTRRFFMPADRQGDGEYKDLELARSRRRA
jgi:DNA-binding NtrC family response regulator